MEELDGLFIPAHIFTPFKSVYGSAVRLMGSFDLKKVAAVELGLSSDSELVDWISELMHSVLMNSDRTPCRKSDGSTTNFSVKEASFEEFRKALNGTDGRKILKNYGLNPRLGKFTGPVFKDAVALHSRRDPVCCTAEAKRESKAFWTGFWKSVTNLAAIRHSVLRTNINSIGIYPKLGKRDMETAGCIWHRNEHPS